VDVIATSDEMAHCFVFSLGDLIKVDLRARAPSCALEVGEEVMGQSTS
jgi:hypothetical protein